MHDARTIRSSALSGFPKLARELRLDPDAIATAAGAPAETFTNPNLRIPLATVTRILADAARQSGVDDFGLRLARRRDLAIWGVLGLVSRDQATLRDVITALRRYTRLHTDGMWLTVEADRDPIELHLNTHETGLALTTQLMADLSLATTHLNMREIMGSGWRPDCVCFRHRRPEQAAGYRRLFGCDVLFDQAFNGILFPARLMDAPVPGADPEQAEQARQRADSLLRASRGRLADSVTEIAIRHLPDGGCDLAATARTLGLTTRTLQRRLAEEETTFAAVLDRARTILCESYVEGSIRPLAEVAGLLGFASQAAFNHWYKQRHGMSPSARRRTGRRPDPRPTAPPRA